jgi:glyoxylate reductase/D-3-phosphoglycerate dehydrogenase
LPANNILVAEDDPFLRMIGVLLDPNTSAERVAAFADFFSHDEPDFGGYRANVRARAGALFPADVRIVKTQREMREALPPACALVVEGLSVGPEEIAAGRTLGVVQKFGALTRNIDREGCAARGIKVITLRRRANRACAEMAFSLMLILAKKLDRVLNRVTVERLADAGYVYRPFDRRHTPNSNWARIPGVRVLHGSTIGIVGLGEIGREIALRAAAFGMRILYHQRHKLTTAEEAELSASYVPLNDLLAESDWIVPILPVGASTRGLIGASEFAHVKRGAVLVNVASADSVDRSALIEALKSGKLGGFGLDPQYEAPAKADDELVRLPNVVLSPHLAGSPRFNMLDDLADLCEGMAKALGLV